MPSTADLDRPSTVRTVANRYLKRERPLSALFVALVLTIFLGTYVVTSLLLAVVVGAVLVVATRAPVLRSHGSVRLHTGDDPAAVADAFTGPTPPVLGLQWGMADEIRTDEETVTYHVSFLFGLRGQELTVHSETDTTPSGDRQIELTVTSDDSPWATYTVTLSPDDSGTRVDVAYTSNRKFGLRRLPQQFVARRFRDDVLTAQGYTVVEREDQFGR